MYTGNENSGGNNPAMSEKEKQTLVEKVKKYGSKKIASGMYQLYDKGTFGEMS